MKKLLLIVLGAAMCASSQAGPLPAKSSMACPARITEFHEYEKAASGRFVGYYVAAAIDPGVFSVSLTVNTYFRERTIHWSRFKKATNQQDTVDGTFDRSSTDVLSINIASVDVYTEGGGSTVTSCDAAPIKPRHTLDSAATLRVVNDNFQTFHEGLLAIGAERSADAPKIVDASFIDRVAPSYPESAARQAQEGFMVALVTIDTLGRPIRVAVSRSTGWAALDAATMSALLRSTFKPATIGGEAIEESYKVIYIFTLSGGLQVALPAPINDMMSRPTGMWAQRSQYDGAYAAAPMPDACTVHIDDALSIVASGAESGRFLAEVTGTSKSSDVKAIDVVLKRAGGSDTPYTWAPFVRDRADGSKGFAIAVELDGPAIITAYVRGVHFKDGQSENCPRQSLFTRTLRAPVFRMTTGNWLRPPGSSALIKPAEFQRKVLPTYPQRELQMGRSGSGKILVSVDESGKPISAIAADSTGSDGLDAAALHAAMSSQYVVDSVPTGSPPFLYEVYFEFR